MAPLRHAGRERRDPQHLRRTEGGGAPHQGLRLGLVSYVDYETGKIEPAADDLARVMHKRRAFRHEEEVRFVKLVDSPHEAPPGGLDVPIDIERLVHGIYIDPYAPEWFEKVVKAVVRQFVPALGERVTWSSMKAAPLY